MANGYNDGLAVTGSDSFSYTQNYLTDVGANTASLSPYSIDQGGNVWERAESATWGGGYESAYVFLETGHHGGREPAEELNFLGFRVARSIPEPSTVLLGAMAAAGLLLRRRRVVNEICFPLPSLKRLS